MAREKFTNRYRFELPEIFHTNYPPGHLRVIQIGISFVMPLYELFCIAAHNPTSPVSRLSPSELGGFIWTRWLTQMLINT